MIKIKGSRELEQMRKSNRMVAEVLAKLMESVKVGVTTRQLDEMAAMLIRSKGARAAFKGYRGYPATICTSINQCVVHGIPTDRALEEGDILSIDLGLVYDGYFADVARTIPVGRISRDAADLLIASRDSFRAGLEMARPNNRVGDISYAIQQRAESMGYSVVRDFVGHGIGEEMHEDPQVPNFGRPNSGARLRAGMTLAIEPMVNIGGPEVEVLEDKWTVVTKDGALSSHYENTVAITNDGPEILTALSDGELD